MKLTIGALRSLQLLAEGHTVPASRMKGAWVERLKEEDALISVPRGSQLSYKALSTDRLRAAVAAVFDVADIEAHIRLMETEDVSRAEAVAATGNSKARTVRTFKGFLLNSYTAIEAELGGSSWLIEPVDGTFAFVYDYENLRIPEDVTVVGIENSENFRHVARQRAFFERELPMAGRLLFVSRYPQEQMGDLVRWLASIPNPYVHFGDLDLAGISIFLTQFYSKLGVRASFLVPSDYRERLLMGSTERYDTQYAATPLRSVADDRLLPLVAAIHEVHRGYDQEGYIDT